MVFDKFHFCTIKQIKIKSNYFLKSSSQDQGRFNKRVKKVQDIICLICGNYLEYISDKELAKYLRQF